MIPGLIFGWLAALIGSSARSLPGATLGSASAMPTIPTLAHDSPITALAPAPGSLNRAQQVFQQIFSGQPLYNQTQVIPPGELAQIGIYSSQPLTRSELETITAGDTWTAETVYPGATDVFGGTEMVYDPQYDPITGALVAGWHVRGTTWDGTAWV